MNPKPYAVLVSEGKSHRTKAELEVRKKGEAAALTGVEMREAEAVRTDEAAHKCFQRIKKLMKAIGKSDAMYEAVVNRYCLMTSETEKLERDRAEMEHEMQAYKDMRDGGEMSGETFAERMTQMRRMLLDSDKLIQQKRKMLLDIEKECMMTVAAALRAIPKKPEKEKADPMQELLARRGSRSAG